MTLVILFAAVWFGFYLAKQLAIPLVQLGRATKRVAAGDYSTLEISSGSEEINSLIGNFNQMINRHRIAHACGLLAEAGATASILEISGRCGFASLGPFNRAFREATGLSPTEWRRQALGQGSPELKKPL